MALNDAVSFRRLTSLRNDPVVAVARRMPPDWARIGAVSGGPPRVCAVSSNGRSRLPHGSSGPAACYGTILRKSKDAFPCRTLRQSYATFSFRCEHHARVGLPHASSGSSGSYVMPRATASKTRCRTLRPDTRAVLRMVPARRIMAVTPLRTRQQVGRSPGASSGPRCLAVSTSVAQASPGHVADKPQRCMPRILPRAPLLHERRP